MRSWTLRFRVINRDNFLAVKNGEKSIETRAATEKYRKVSAGDILVIVCGKDKLKKKVKKVRVFKTLKSLPRKQIMPWTRNFDEMRNAYYSYPGYKEKIKKFGIIAFYL